MEIIQELKKELKKQQELYKDTDPDELQHEFFTGSSVGH